MLTAYLSRFKGQKLVILASTGEETWSFANEFKRLLSGKEVGWNVEGPIKAPIDQRVMDIQLSMDEDSFGGKESDAVMTLKDALNFTRLVARKTIVADPAIYPHEIGMWIGPASPGGEVNIIVPLEIECRNSIQFSEQAVTPQVKIPEKAQYARIISVRSPQNKFLIGDTFRVRFSDPLVSVSNTTDVGIQVVGKLMPRNDVLEITSKTGSNEAITFEVMSDRDSKVQCVGMPR
jgi:hypothetical protein